MNRRVTAVFSIMLGIILSLSASSARAIETAPTNFLVDPPLLISGYAWQGTDFSYLQLYNNSDEVQNISDYRLFVQDANSVRTEFVMNAIITSKLLAPHAHVIASYNSSVNGASLILNQVMVPNLTQTVKAKLIVAPVKAGSYREAEYTIASGTNTVWQRNFSSTGQGYVSSFTGSSVPPSSLFDDGLYQLPDIPDLRVIEVYSYSSECAPTDTSVLCGDYIKLQTGTMEEYAGYVLRTDSNSSSRTTSNTFYLADYPVDEGGYITISTDEDGKKLSITNSGGYIWLEDLYGLQKYEQSVVRYESASSDEQGYAWATTDNGSWQWTTTPQPGLPNKITSPIVTTVSCPEGKYLNPDTGRCRTIEEAVNALATCPEGQYRNPTTNRCKQLVTTASASLLPCAEGQERNPATNRCRSIVSAVAELIPCDEGYERNPSTNRCRKVTGTSIGAGSTASAGTMASKSPDPLAAWGWALAGVAATGAVGYGIYEWRHEISKGWKSLVGRSARK